MVATIDIPESLIERAKKYQGRMTFGSPAISS